MPKNWCLQTVLLEKTPESPLNCAEIKPVNLNENQPWILIGRIDAEAPVFWSSDVNSQLIGKVPDTGKDRGQKERRASWDEMARWPHWSNGHELGQTLGDGEGYGGLTCCSPWGCKESDITGWLNNNKVCIWGFPGGPEVKKPPTSGRGETNPVSIPGSERSFGVGNGNSLQYSCLGNSMDRGAMASRRLGHNWAHTPASRSVYMLISTS